MRVPAGMNVLLAFAYFRTAVPLADAEDDELRRFDRGDADDANEFAVVNVGLGHRRSVALHEESFLFLQALQHPVAPQAREEVANAASYPRPRRFVIDFKDHPLGTALN